MEVIDKKQRKRWDNDVFYIPKSKVSGNLRGFQAYFDYKGVNYMTLTPPPAQCDRSPL